VISMNANSGQELVRLRRKSLNRRCNSLRDEVSELLLLRSVRLLMETLQLDSYRVLLSDMAMVPDSLVESEEENVSEGPDEIEPIPALNIIEPGEQTFSVSFLLTFSICRLVRDDCFAAKDSHVRDLVRSFINFFFPHSLSLCLSLSLTLTLSLSLSLSLVANNFVLLLNLLHFLSVTLSSNISLILKVLFPHITHSLNWTLSL
jgi:hypothetical protein